MSISLKKLLYRHFSLLSSEEERQVTKQILENHKCAEINAELEHRMAGNDIPVPDMSEMGSKIWQQAMVEGVSRKFRLKRRSLLQRFAVSASAVAVLLVALFTVFRTVPGAKSPLVIAKLFPAKKGGGVLIKRKDGSLVRPPQGIVTLKSGMQVAVAAKAQFVITLPDKGRLNLVGPVDLRLLHNSFVAGKPKLIWEMKQGRVIAFLNKKSYTQFSVSTPHALVSVTGTRFVVSVSSAKTEIKVISGKVESQLKADPEKKIEMTAGSSADFTSEKIVVPDKKDKQQKKLPKKQPTKNETPKKKAFKERVYLKNGMVITGKVLSQDKNVLVVRTSGGVLKIAREKIKVVRYMKK